VLHPRAGETVGVEMSGELLSMNSRLFLCVDEQVTPTGHSDPHGPLLYLMAGKREVPLPFELLRCWLRASLKTFSISKKARRSQPTPGGHR